MARKKSRIKLSKKTNKRLLVKSKPLPNPMIKVLTLTIIIVLGFSISLFILNQNAKQKMEKEEFQSGPNATSTPTKNPQVNNQTNNNKMSGINYFVDPELGSDSNLGLTKNSSFKTIQKGLSKANPSDVVNLLNGTYLQNFITVRDGTSDKPITIKGEKGAIVKGSGGSRIIEINHNNIHLEGFSVDGLVGDPNDKKSYRDKLIYVLGKRQFSGVTGLKITRMVIQNAGGECIRLRYYATGNEIAYNEIGSCGAFDFKFESNNKNGEGIYIGTSADQWNDGKNPTNGSDKSTKNYIHNNTINTKGNECVDIKEGSSENIIEYNSCTGQMDEESGGLDARGDRNIFRYNLTFGNKGAGIRLGGHTIDGIIYGLGNDVYNNTFRQNQAGGIKIETEPQGKICANNMSENGSREKFGSKADNYYPTSSCR